MVSGAARPPSATCTGQTKTTGKLGLAELNHTCACSAEIKSYLWCSTGGRGQVVELLWGWGRGKRHRHRANGTTLQASSTWESIVTCWQSFGVGSKWASLTWVEGKHQEARKLQTSPSDKGHLRDLGYHSKNNLNHGYLVTKSARIASQEHHSNCQAYENYGRSPWKGRDNSFSRWTLERLIQRGASDSICHTWPEHVPVRSI